MMLQMSARHHRRRFIANNIAGWGVGVGAYFGACKGAGFLR